VRICGLDSSGSGEGLVVGCCEHGNEPWGSIKGGEFLDQVSDCCSMRLASVVPTRPTN